MASPSRPRRPDTRLTAAGRAPRASHGFVNPPVYRGSTVLFPTADAYRGQDQEYTYGRVGTPTSRALESAIADIEGGHAACLVPSGLAAISTALLAFADAGDHVLIADSVYRPTRSFCDQVLARLGIEVTYYDPTAGAGVGDLLRDETAVVFAESPGSQTFEVQDLPAIAGAAHDAGAVVIVDNTWASPLYFAPFDHGADVSIQAATKYICGHSDILLGAVSASEAHWPRLDKCRRLLGQCAGPDDVYLALRGLRTLAVRLERHMRTGIALAEWLEQRPEVACVLHPALPSHPGHALWRRDFTGASGLFTIVLEPAPKEAADAMVNGLELFGIGASWGGFESLVLPFDPRGYRTATEWPHRGQALRLHAGLEDLEDLKADLEAGFARFSANRETAS